MQDNPTSEKRQPGSLHPAGSALQHPLCKTCRHATEYENAKHDDAWCYMFVAEHPWLQEGICAQHSPNPWVATSGSEACPCEYNNSLHAALHSLLSAMKCDEMEDVQKWMKTASRQLKAAIRESAKPGAMVPVVGARYTDPENVKRSQKLEEK